MLIKDHPEGLENKMIQEIGEVYLANHRKWSLFHHSHVVAAELKGCNSEETSEQKWRFLAERFEKLPSIKGEIADKILNMFREAFGEYIPMDKVHKEDSCLGEHFCIKHLKNEEVAKYLKGISKSYYDRKYHNNHYRQKKLV